LQAAADTLDEIGAELMDQDQLKILVIDDDPKVPWILSEGLKEFEIVSARDGAEGISAAREQQPQLVLLDIKMPGMDGLEVLSKIKEQNSSQEVIMLSGHGDTQHIVESIRLGAAEFINKPFDVREVEIHIRKVLERSLLKEENIKMRKRLSHYEAQHQLIGDSNKIRDLKSLIEQVADSELAVLIRGESGTGKEIVARTVHALSSRSPQEFVKVNCAAIPRDLLESELFGYEKGAFTGATRTKPGRFEVADGGTMFLDEVGDMPLELQSKLLQVLEQHEFVRVGGVHNIKVDVRIVCATNRNLEEAIADKQFRDDLFYRLNEITLPISPLRDRREDIPVLVDHFLRKYAQEYGRETKPVTPEALRFLQNQPWPGNVRQLENLIKQVVVRDDEQILYDLLERKLSGPGALPPLESDPIADEADGLSLKKRVARTVEREERRLISEVLRRTNWNRRKAAKILEISYRSLLYKIKDYRLNEIAD
jgi:two-component system response regulator AtoC